MRGVNGSSSKSHGNDKGGGKKINTVGGNDKVEEKGQNKSKEVQEKETINVSNVRDFFQSMNKGEGENEKVSNNKYDKVAEKENKDSSSSEYEVIVNPTTTSNLVKNNSPERERKGGKIRIEEFGNEEDGYVLPPPSSPGKLRSDSDIAEWLNIK